MFRLTVARLGKTITTYLRNNSVSVLLPKYKESDHEKLRAFMKSARKGGSLELKDRAGKQTVITRIR